MSVLLVFKIIFTYNDDYILEGQEQLNGMFKTFYEDGTVKSLENFKNGKRDGVNIYYDSLACIRSIKSFEDGKLDGKSFYFSLKEDTVFFEDYAQDRLIEKVILNDSLYNFQLHYLDYGMTVFNNNCRSCHEFNDNQLLDSSVSIIEKLDSTLLDSGYVYIFHHKLEVKDSLIELSDSINVLLNIESKNASKKNIEALYLLFKQELNRPRLKYKKVRKVYKRVKVS